VTGSITVRFYPASTPITRLDVQIRIREIDSLSAQAGKNDLTHGGFPRKLSITAKRLSSSGEIVRESKW
jgi:hypothetical protein